MAPEKEELKRFWDKVQKSQGCWEWQAAKNQRGYGAFSNKLITSRSAHRYSYTIHFGPIPDGLHVLHKCDNPSCVRPDHLSVGDHRQNMVESVVRNRVPRGSAAGRTRLTPKQVLEIVQLRKAGVPLRTIGQSYGVTYGAVVSIMNGESWSHVTGFTKKLRAGSVMAS